MFCEMSYFNNELFGKEVRMKKLIPIIVICAFLLCGCREDYDKKDIKEYVKTEYGLKAVSVEEEPEAIQDEDNRTDYIWTVTDKKHNMKFRVLDDFQANSLFPDNTLDSDYEDVRVAQAFGRYDSKKLSLETKTKFALCSATIKGSYSSREELQELFEETNTFLRESLNNEVKVSIHFMMDTPYRETVEGYEMDSGDYRGTATEFTQEMYEEAEENLLLTAVDYRLDTYLEQFTESEIKDVVANSKYRLGIADTENGPYEYYDDLISNRYFYGVSFSTLYEIMVREGYPVEGNKTHYSFVGVDGSTYEISYDFVGYEYDDGKVGYYYLKDGVETPMDAYFYNHFETPFIRDTTGIYLREYWHEEE